MSGLAKEWGLNQGLYAVPDYLFGTDYESYIQDPRGKTKSFVYGQYTGDALSIITGATELVTSALVIVSGGLFSIGAVPFTGGASLTVAPVAVGVTTVMATHGSTAIVSAAKNMGEGHNWDPQIHQKINWKTQKEKLNKHKDINGRSGDLSTKSEPNSSNDLYVDGELYQRRFFDENGRVIKDIDFKHGEKPGSHEFPHEHFWEWIDDIPQRK